MHRSTLPLILAVCSIGAPSFAQAPGSFSEQLVDSAMERLTHWATYDGSYRLIDYPNGDVPDNIGAGPSLDDILFELEITGHYRYEVAE